MGKLNQQEGGDHRQLLISQMRIYRKMHHLWWIRLVVIASSTFLIGKDNDN